MKFPHGVAFFSGKVFVSDTDNHRILIFSADGKFLKSFGQKGKNAREFSNPTCLSVKLAVLVDRGRRELPFSADFAGATMTLDPSQELVLKNDNNVLRFDIQQKS